ncbi:MAG TPA: L-histidine N(alpha)-methyltransferase [Actinomycetota bacterium]|jgi:L-histidine N-alpha-methyltransferase|nr:L-histidine N(alpha)-methyltransferase [Actinomycetota bacterium]
MLNPAATVQVDVHVTPGDLERALRKDVRTGLSSRPKVLPPKWFYDDRGSELFDEITRLPEYYLTRCEREILDNRAAEIARATAAHTLVELGSGTSEKTRLLLSALAEAGTLRRFVPFDVSEGVLRWAADQINDEYPGIEVHAVVGDFDHHLHAIPDGDSRLIAFLGSTIGNFTPEARSRFWSDLAAGMHDGDSLLVGFDLVKDVGRLEAAYNDGRGVTAEFNANVLRVINHRLGANFDPERFEHIAFFDRDAEWIEMRLRSTHAQRVRLSALDLEIAFGSGEEMRTEISAKFTPERIRAELSAAGLRPSRSWTDDAGDFALVLAQKSQN